MGKRMSPRVKKSAALTPTVYSIAQACGVSGTTVSLALRDDPRLRPETRAKIQACARKVGYRPNLAARHFKQGATGTLGLILPSATWWVDTLMLDELYRQAAQAGYDLQVQFTHDDLRQEAKALGRCLQGKVDGLFMTCTFENESELPADYPLADLRLGRVPCVFLTNTTSDIPSVHRDRVKAVDLAVRHLVEEGYDEIYLLIAVRGPETESFKGRAKQFRKTLRSLSLPAGDGRIHFRTSTFQKIDADKPDQPARTYFDYTMHDRYGYELARDIFSQSADPAGSGRIALVCTSDSLAAGAMRYCQEHGLAIPEQVGVIGCDDTIANSLGLSTFQWDHPKMCAVVMDLLQKQIAGKKVRGTNHAIEPRLVVRRSTRSGAVRKLADVS
jgi:LacI family transcriptional regulator